MQVLASNTTKRPYHEKIITMTVQKCKPSFDDATTTIKRAPFTQLYNKVIQNCTNMEAIAVWAYLQSQSDNWELSPNQLKKHFGVGKNKIYKILTFMICANLLVRHVQFAQNGRRITTSYTVLDGTEYIEPARDAQENAPFPQKREVDNREMDNRDYIKERGLKKKDNKKEISIDNSAFDNAQEKNDYVFEEFWKTYPIKKNKIRTKKIWDKNKYDKLVTLICCDVLTRISRDVQWQNKQYIPHPSTYLINKLWEDDITDSSSIKKFTGKNSAWSEYQQDIKNQQRGNVYEHSSISQ